jgi:hypothetical protein
MQSSWAKRRKILFFSIFLILLIIAGSGIYFFGVKQSPTCFDGKRNQNEKNIDCGGVCQRLCVADLADPIVLWQRSFEVQPGFYSATAYVRNPNATAEIQRSRYVFRFYDAQNALIGERTGTTFIPPNQTSAIFESGLQTKGRVIARTDFAFIDAPQWTQLYSSSYYPTLSVSNIRLTDTTSTPRLQAQVTNPSGEDLSKIEAIVIGYTAEGLAIASSKTIIDSLAARETKSILFTWPQPWSDVTVRQEIVLKIYPAALLQ